MKTNRLWMPTLLLVFAILAFAASVPAKAAYFSWTWESFPNGDCRPFLERFPSGWCYGIATATCGTCSKTYRGVYPSAFFAPVQWEGLHIYTKELPSTDCVTKPTGPWQWQFKLPTDCPPGACQGPHQ